MGKRRRIQNAKLEIDGQLVDARYCNNPKCTQSNPQPLDAFPVNTNRTGGWMTICKACNRARNRKYQRENRHIKRLIAQRRRARKRALPDTLTLEEMKRILDTFGHACALTGRKENIHLDHFIPLHTGHGGTMYNNMVPLCAELNASKGKKNPFEWIKTRPPEERLRFHSVVNYLANLNNMSYEQYKEYVYSCFSNPVNLVI